MTGEKQRYWVQGMDCAACAETIKLGVSQLDGVAGCSLEFSTALLQVEGTVSPQAVVERVHALGYQASLAGADDAVLPESGHRSFLRFLWQSWETRLALFGGLLILPALLFQELLPSLGFNRPWLNLAAVAAAGVAGFPVGRRAWHALRFNRQITIDVLMALAALGALAIGAYAEGGLVVVLFSLGEALEGYTAGQARQALRSLMDLVPRETTRLGPAGEERLPLQALAAGDLILVKPGEAIGLDGQVKAGRGGVNQAPVTGESLPVFKQPGDPVYAGSINGPSALTILVTQPAANSTISRLVRLVAEAQAQKAPTERFVDRFARYYTPAIVALAALVAVVPPLFFGQPFLNPADGATGWLYRALALLVIACPCALVISTPVSVISATANAARNGVLVKGGAFLEALASVRAVALDKTGTLTEGKPAVVRVQAVGCAGETSGSCPACDDMLALAGAVEQQSEHPLAQALVDRALAVGSSGRHGAASGVKALVGQGVTGQVNGQAVTVASHAYFDASVPHPEAHCLAASAAARQGHTALLVGGGDAYLGYILVADPVRQGSAAVVRALHESGIAHCLMLTGDEEGTAQAVAQIAGVDEVRANLMPAGKVEAVRQLRARFGPVAMVGDGINDAPALAAADVGVAMGGAGNAQAMETADVALLSDGLDRLPYVIRLSREAMRTVKANVAFSLGLKLLFLFLLLAGLGSMWLAVLADMGASLLVTLNGMRLLGRRPENGPA